MTAVKTAHGARRARASADRETVAWAVPAKNPHRRVGGAAIERLRSYQRLAARHVATAEDLVVGCVEGGSMT
jgi:hypothetical protein